MTEQPTSPPLFTDDLEARRLLVAVPIAETTTLTEDERKQIVATVRNYMVRYGLSNRDVSRNVKGLGPSTISEILTGKYVSSTLDDHLRQLNAFIGSDAKRRAAKREKQPLTTTFVVRALQSAVQMCKENPTMGYVTGPAGVGKTATLKELERKDHALWLITVNANNAAVHPMIRALCQAFNLWGGRSKKLRGLTPYERLVERLKGSHNLLAFDEAHKLQPRTLELLREIHDQTGVSVLLVGCLDLAELIHASTDADHGQLERRFGVRVDVRRARNAQGPKDGGDQPLFTPEDIRAIFTKPGLRLTAGSLAFVRRLANASGEGGIGYAEHLTAMAARYVRKRDKLEHQARATIAVSDLEYVLKISASMPYSEDVYKGCLEEGRSVDGAPAPEARTA